MTGIVINRPQQLKVIVCWISFFSAEVFASLEQPSGSGTKASEIGVLSYGVSMTDLEEVFLKLEGDEEDDEASDHQSGKGVDNGAYSVNRTDGTHINGATHTSQQTGGINLSELGKATVRGSHLLKNRIYTLVKLRILLTYRIKKRIYLQVILPIIFTCIGAGVLTVQPGYDRVNPIELDISSLKHDYLAPGDNPPLDYVGGKAEKMLTKS